MKITVVAILALIFLSGQPSLAQRKVSIGLQGGRSVLVAETASVPNQLSNFKACGTGGVNMLLYARYYFSPEWSARMGGGIIGYRAGYSHTFGTYPAKFMGVQP